MIGPTPLNDNQRIVSGFLFLSQLYDLSYHQKQVQNHFLKLFIARYKKSSVLLVR